MMRKIIIGFNRSKIVINVRELSNWQMYFGLMFKQSESDNLLFNKKGFWGIHSFFVFFPFLAVWLDEKKRVLEWRIIKPFTFFVRPRRKFSKLIEIPFNKRNKQILFIFRRQKQRFKYINE